MHVLIGEDDVAIILTLASPHTHPPMSTQPSMSMFYSDLAKSRYQVATISINGGPKDLQVPSILTNLPSEVKPPAIGKDYLRQALKRSAESIVLSNW